MGCIWDKIEMYEYPTHEQLWNGVPIGVGYDYVSHTYVNGFINYLSDKKEERILYLVKRYAEEEEFVKYQNKLIEDSKDFNKWFHYDFGTAADDIIILSVLEDSYVMLYNDRDCSDCMIARWPLDSFENFEDFNKGVVEWYSNQIQEGEENSEWKGIVKIGYAPTGWIHL